MNFTEQQWRELAADGILRVPGACRDRLAGLTASVEAIMARYPYGFEDPHYYSGKRPRPLTAENKRPHGRAIVPNVGFLDPSILLPLADPGLHDFIARIVGKDFYLSNTWFQVVGPGTDRLSFHKDPRGCISFNILLDDIGPGMGSTCVVPGTHINTPPAAYCMADLFAPHPREVEATGEAGDIVFFSTEAWHGRAKNLGGRSTRRLFYNFYSRSSRETTTWDGIVEPAQLEAVRALFPPQFQHMFEIDRPRSRALAQVGGSALRRWAYRSSTSDTLLRDFFYAGFAYGRPAENAARPGFLLPFTTRLAEARRFSAAAYLSHLKIVPSLKNCYVFMRTWLAGLRRGASPRAAAAAE